MVTSGTCANCGSALPADQPAAHQFCPACSAAWHRGDAQEGQPVTGDGPGLCANCGTPLPPGQPAGHHYCARCAAAWQRGKSRRQ